MVLEHVNQQRRTAGSQTGATGRRPETRTAMSQTNEPTQKTPPSASERRAAWIEAARPRTLPLAASGAIVAAAIAVCFAAFRWEVFVLMFLTCVLLQVIANFADDYGDLSHGLDDETRVGPKRGLQRGVITVSQMKKALIGTCALTFALGVALVAVSFAGGPTMDGASWVFVAVFVALGALCIAAALLYTMGKHPYGYIGLGDFISFLFFGIVAVVGGCFLYLHAFEPASLVGGIALGLPVMAVMNVNNMRDAKRDAAKGKRTVANMLGDPGMRVYETVLLAVAAVLFVVTAVMCSVTSPVAYALMVVSFAPWVRVLYGIWTTPDHEKFDRFMAPTSLGSVFVALVFCIATVFID